jgi:hypothetical protein
LERAAVVKKVAVECGQCGNVDYVDDVLILIAFHKCTVCQATGGKVQLSGNRFKKEKMTN